MLLGRLLVAWLVIVLGGCTPTVATIEPTVAASGRAPDFTLPLLDGGTISLAELRGRWVLVNFWATWCGPCREEMPYLDGLARQSRPTLTVIGINMREDAAEVRAFADGLDITFPLALQPDDATLLAYDVIGLPISVVVAPDGNLARRITGPLVPAEFDAWLEPVTGQ